MPMKKSKKYKYFFIYHYKVCIRTNIDSFPNISKLAKEVSFEELV